MQKHFNEFDPLSGELDLFSKQFAGKNLNFFSDPAVWAPYSAGEMMDFLFQAGYLSELADKTVLDMGTGSGIIGTICGTLGAKEVWLSDYSEAAARLAQKNAEANQVKGIGIQSDRFRAFGDQTFDLIISNPPVQPWLYTDQHDPLHRLSSAAWNEAGKDGRLVLDALISESDQYLSTRGQLLTSSSSRHGHRQTLALLDQHWGDRWKIIYSSEHPIDPNYHQPYMRTWRHLQRLDGDLRVYQKDAQGRCFAPYQDENGQALLISTWEQAGESIPVKILKSQASRVVVQDFSGEKLAEIPTDDPRLPSETADSQWYYQYYLLLAWK